MLPTEEIYNEFGKVEECTVSQGKPDKKQEIEAKLKTELDWLRSKYEDCASKFENALCYALNMDSEEKHYGQRCNLLYYWIGDKIRGKLRMNSSFSSAISRVHDALQKFGSEWSCNYIYDAISDTLFEKAKVLFDYYYNYYKLQDQTGYKQSPLCPKLKQKWQDTKRVYTQVEGMCDPNNATADRTCYQEFKSKLKEYEEILKSELKCDTIPDAEPPLMSTSSTRVLTKRDLQNLPSRNAYRNLITEWPQCMNKTSEAEKIKSSLKDKLKNGENEDIYASKVASTWCYVCEMRTENPSYEERCGYFYYWLGSTLMNILGDPDKFQGVMNEIYAKLETSGPDGVCRIMDTTVDYTIFKQRKELFDFIHDYSTIRDSLAANESHCTQAYSNYIEKAKEPYQMVKTNCAIDSGNDPCCKLLNGKKDGLPTQQDLQKLTCKVVQVPDDEPGIEEEEEDEDTGTEEGEGEETTEGKTVEETVAVTEDDEVSEEEPKKCNDVSGEESTNCPSPPLQEDKSKVQLLAANEGSPLKQAGSSVNNNIPTTPIAPIVSSTIATIGLPTILFFLYKYTSIFSGISNTFGNNSKRKRMSAIRREFNDFQEHDDDGSSTEYTTEMSSTATNDDSTTLYSVPYIR